jgi:hypothetical protein
MENNTITITAFKATDRPDLCARYAEEHRAILEEFGVSEVVKPNEDWMQSEDCIVILAEHDELGYVGGIRVQKGGPSTPLPMESSMGAHAQQFTLLLQKYQGDSGAEVCGLWNAHRFAGKGLPLVLSMAAVSVANQAGLCVLYCFVAHYTLRHALKVGFQIMEDFGDGGAISYPIPRIKSFAMVIPDAILLETAPERYRARIISLRCRPDQDSIEAPAGVPFGVRYRLRLPDNGAHQGIYADILRHYQQIRA